MNKEVKLCDISDFGEANCWIVNLIPFGPDDRSKKDEILAYQKKCINAKIFGMGGRRPKNFNSPVALNRETQNKYINECGQDKSVKKALDNYSKIKVGDFVIMRLKNSHIYIGRVCETARYNSNKVDIENRLSWYCEVEKWEDFENITELPSEIIGRLSQRRQPTIIRISDDKYRQKLLIAKAYLEKQGNKDIPKVVINKNNFCSCMYYM